MIEFIEFHYYSHLLPRGVFNFSGLISLFFISSLQKLHFSYTISLFSILVNLRDLTRSFSACKHIWVSYITYYRLCKNQNKPNKNNPPKPYLSFCFVFSLPLPSWLVLKDWNLNLFVLIHFFANWSLPSVLLNQITAFIFNSYVTFKQSNSNVLKLPLKKRFYLFIFREREREGEKHRCEREPAVGCLLHSPWPGT